MGEMAALRVADSVDVRAVPHHHLKCWVLCKGVVALAPPLFFKLWTLDVVP